MPGLLLGLVRHRGSFDRFADRWARAAPAPASPEQALQSAVLGLLHWRHDGAGAGLKPVLEQPYAPFVYFRCCAKKDFSFSHASLADVSWKLARSSQKNPCVASG
jgi:hypothetical protein